MPSLTTKGSFSKIYSLAPIIILFISVLNEFDFNYLNLDYFSFNFPFILIFFFSLKDFKHFDYLLVFIAGLINDTVVGLPLGISSLSYMIICISTSKDRYKRYLATCYKEKINLNKWMVRRGYAVAYKRYSKDYVRDENYARENKLGIWQGKFIRPEKWRKLN